jgi:capsular polysaccharide transport system ATP-binding protein
VIELRNVTKLYATHHGPHLVLDDITLTFPATEAVGIVGCNGAGKSTLLRLIGGAELPTAGEIVRHGRVSWPIGFTGGFNGSLSGEENCRFVARIYGQDVDRVVDETRAFAALSEYFYEPIRTYSSGMRARLAFGLSMAIDFDVYLVDEVTAVGDSRFRRKSQAAFLERKRRSGLIMVAHQIATLQEYCTRCALLDRGILTMYESVDEAAAEYERRMST